MKIIQRRYDILSDFHAVFDFLTATYDFETLNSYLLPHYWEYAQYLQWFDYIRAHRMGLWEAETAGSGRKIVAISAYEMEIGKAHLHTAPEYRHLLPELLDWAERELATEKDGKKLLGVWITNKETTKQDLLNSRGYRLVYEEPVKIFRYENAFVERKLPDGFNLISGLDVDFSKLAECYWRGFDHDEIPPEVNIDGNVKIMNTPHANPALATIVVAPNGEYACALGMWVDEVNKYAYLEPLATVPKYRRLGLATIALTEAMKKTKAYGAEYCFGGGREFYTDIGFETICNREIWENEEL
ncbi:MAG: GNAT family N-acetyltransferase [Lachnospiraceae bacterium]|nr:GNAT family N-acetyltransferase [Lachnospiraceae bacterium]